MCWRAPENGRQYQGVSGNIREWHVDASCAAEQMHWLHPEYYGQQAERTYSMVIHGVIYFEILYDIVNCWMLLGNGQYWAIVPYCARTGIGGRAMAGFCPDMKIPFWDLLGLPYPPVAHSWHSTRDRLRGQSHGGDRARATSNEKNEEKRNWYEE